MYNFVKKLSIFANFGFFVGNLAAAAVETPLRILALNGPKQDHYQGQAVACGYFSSFIAQQFVLACESQDGHFNQQALDTLKAAIKDDQRVQVRFQTFWDQIPSKERNRVTANLLKVTGPAQPSSVGVTVDSMVDAVISDIWPAYEELQRAHGAGMLLGVPSLNFFASSDQVMLSEMLPIILPTFPAFQENFKQGKPVGFLWCLSPERFEEELAILGSNHIIFVALQKRDDGVTAYFADSLPKPMHNVLIRTHLPKIVEYLDSDLGRVIEQKKQAGPQVLPIPQAVLQAPAPQVAVSIVPAVPVIMPEVPFALPPLDVAKLVIDAASIVEAEIAVAQQEPEVSIAEVIKLRPRVLKKNVMVPRPVVHGNLKINPEKRAASKQSAHKDAKRKKK